MGTWNAYGNEYWPADYLIDAKGKVRYAAFGEGDYGKTETAIRALLGGSGLPGRREGPPDRRGRALGNGHAGDVHRHRARGRLVDGAEVGHARLRRRRRSPLSLNEFAYSGTWKITPSRRGAIANAGIDVEFKAKHVYLVLSSPGERPLPVQVLLDGHPIPAADAGADVHDGVVTVRRQRLYALVSLPGDQQHRLSLRFAPA